MITPKSRAGQRTVFLLEKLRPYVSPLIEGRDGDELVFGVGVSPFDARGVARKAERAWKAVDAARAEQELPPIDRYTLHEARHSFSTWLDHAGVSADRADRYMGFSSGGVASRYRHLLPGQMVDDAKRLDAYLSGSLGGKVVSVAAAQ